MTRSQWLEALSGLSREVAKVAVFWSSKIKASEGMPLLQTFHDSVAQVVLLLHGSTQGAGPSLLSSLRIPAMALVEESITFINGAVKMNSKGIDSTERERKIPMWASRVLDACESLKKTPGSNQAAIGRNLAQLAVSVKDVVREISEMRGSEEGGERGEGGDGGVGEDGREIDDSRDTDSGEEKQEREMEKGDRSLVNGNGNGKVEKGKSKVKEGNEDGDGKDEAEEQEGEDDEFTFDFEGDFSNEDLKVSKEATDVCVSVQRIFKETIYVVALWKEPNFRTNGGINDIRPKNGVESMEAILEICRNISREIDELGASLYPPQELEGLLERVKNVEKLLEKLEEGVLESLGDVPRKLLDAIKQFQLSAKSFSAVVEEVKEEC